MFRNLKLKKNDVNWILIKLKFKISVVKYDKNKCFKKVN